MTPATLTLRGLSKSHAGVPALRDVTLDLRGGEVHALMGENGAGKSTLIRVLAGLARADAVEATLDGAPLALGTPQASARAGFRFVHQELHVVPGLSVAETIFLGLPLPRRLGLAVDWRALEAAAGAALARFGIRHIDPGARAGRLPTGDAMLIRLASLLAGDARPRLVVLDEPTAALTHAESERLFAVIRRLRAEGAMVLYVSHRLDEIMALADRVTVLRDGRVVLAESIAGIDRAGIIAAMTGRDVAEAPARAGPSRPGVALRLDGAASGRLSDLDVTLAPGEVLGLAGLENAGQTDLLRLLLGEGRLRAGRAEVLGGPLPRSPAEAWARGLAYVPRERRREGLMPRRSVAANAVLAHLARLSPGGVARPGREEAAARGLMARLGIKAQGPGQAVRLLSGGNQQKVLLGRAMLTAPRLLLLDEPTRGVDVGARADIHEAIRRLAGGGAAVVLASSDLHETLALSDRVLVLRDGAQAALAPARGLDAAGLLALVYGARAA